MRVSNLKTTINSKVCIATFVLVLDPVKGNILASNNIQDLDILRCF